MKKNLEVVRNFCNHLFDVYDEDESNGLDCEEVTLLLKDICIEYELPEMSDDQISDIIKKFDADGNGVFDREELFAIVEPLFTSTQSRDFKIDPQEIKRKLTEINITLGQKKGGGFIPGLRALLEEKQNCLDLAQKVKKRQGTIMENFAKQFLNQVGVPVQGKLTPIPEGGMPYSNKLLAAPRGGINMGTTPAIPPREPNQGPEPLSIFDSPDPGPRVSLYTPDIDVLNFNGINNSKDLLPLDNLTHPEVAVRNFKKSKTLGTKKATFGSPNRAKNSKRRASLGDSAVDCKIFWEQTFASFFFWIFGLEFAVPRGIWRIRRITAEICRICQI